MVTAQEGVNVGVEGLHLEINASTAIKLAIGKCRCEKNQRRSMIQVSY
jgi:hypothetical protein